MASQRVFDWGGGALQKNINVDYQVGNFSVFHNVAVNTPCDCLFYTWYQGLTRASIEVAVFV